MGVVSDIIGLFPVEVYSVGGRVTLLLLASHEDASLKPKLCH